MKTRLTFWVFLGLLLAGAWFFWHQDHRAAAQKKIAAKPSVLKIRAASTAPKILGLTVPKSAVKAGASVVSTNKFAYRLSNTSKSIGELVRDEKAILLANALIDTRLPLNFSIPKNLQAQGDPGAYIVQANGPIDGTFRAMLAAAGATVVSYIPNDAYLVRASSGVANGIANNGFSVIPYEPYYKISAAPLAVRQKLSAWSPAATNRVARTTLLDLAVNQKPLPAGTDLKLGLFADNAAATVRQIEKLGGKILSRDRSPFGPVVSVRPPKNWTALAQLSGVQIVEPASRRVPANDLSRVVLGISTDTVTSTNYMNLTGTNVIVEMNDSGVDATNPDLTGRVFGDAPQSLVDTNGHGTHVAGIIAGSGVESDTIDGNTNTLPQGSVLDPVAGNTDFRGKAPAAELYSVGGVEGDDTNVITDAYLQEQPALTNALISNNSWGYGDDGYDLAAASYDAATRDALPGMTGSQPVLFVFAAGNDGGDTVNDGSGGTVDTIESPGTAKDVITVGATEQLRNITNIVTGLNGSSNAVWQPMTDTSYQVAGYSSRGNVGVGTEGAFGRYKPDVVAPGNFVVSTRSAQWDQAAYYNPTNYSELYYPDQTVNTNFPNYYSIDLSTTPNVVGITIIVTNNSSTTGTLNLPIYISQPPDPNNFPDPTTPGTYFSNTIPNTITIPTDGGANYLVTAITNGGFNYAVGDSGTQPANYDLIVEITTTNDNGNYYQVLSNLNNTLGPYYRYETGTSMAAPAVSGMLALMQDFFTNTWHVAPPSPALFKAMLINGARTTSLLYDLQVQNSINFEGWGLANLPDSLPFGLTTNFNTACSMFILDQNPTTALATGDSQTFTVNVSSNALAQPLRVTLAWTDPPGNPAAAVKLVNDLNLVVTNLDNPSIVYYGNDISSGDFNNQESTNSPPVFDDINNVENVYLPAGAGTNFSVTVMGYRVNVNAVTAQTNNFLGNPAPNIVQDYALVVSSGNGTVTNAITVTASTPVIASNPTGDQQITYISTNNVGELLNQTVGANSPLLGTNTISFSTNNPEGIGPDNWQVTIGQTNQWHFYVVTNNGSNGNFTNAAFVTFDPDTLSIPRTGVFADSQANATQPEADIDLYVSTDPALTNLDPNVISNCVISGTQVGASAGLNFTNSSLSRGGSEFVVDTNSTPGEVYYVGVKSETQEASEYDFLPIFSATPFSILTNGTEIVNGFPAFASIPDGNPAVPGYTDVVGVAIFPIQARSVVVSNEFYAQDFSDLVGAVNHNDTSVILNNHDSPNAPGFYTFVYDDDIQGIVGSQPSDGPGSLNSFIGEDGTGAWILHEADNAEGFTNIIDSFNVIIQPHETGDNSHTNTVQAFSWYYDYVNVPPGATNLTITVTNLTAATPPLELFVKYGALPTTNSFDEMTLITNADALGLDGSISIGPPLTSGVYYYGVYNPSATPQSSFINWTVLPPNPTASQSDFTSSGPAPILDDAVTTNSIFVSPGGIISSVNIGLAVNHPRISDLVFHLISPDGTRVLLMENRGGTSTNGAGAMLVETNGTSTATNYSYLTFTENTNLTTTPIKFAVPPFDGSSQVTTDATVMSDGFDNAVVQGGLGGYGAYEAGQYVDGWLVETGDVDVCSTTFGFVSPGAADSPPNCLDLNGNEAGTISTNFSTVVGQSYTLNFAYTKNPNAISTLANVSVGSQNFQFTYDGANSLTNLNWAYTSVVFTATSPMSTLRFSGLNSGMNGMFLDSVKVSELESGGLYYLPEQSLDAYAGKNSAGDWLLEIQDDRAGAGLTNTLESWQLQFTYTTATSSLTNGESATNSLQPGGIAYYLVNVPTNADFATNSLFTTSGPLNFWFNETIPPSGTGSPGDYLLFNTSANQSTVLSTVSAPTNIVPGGTYYLAVQNTNTFAVTNFAVEVDFHLLTVTNLTAGQPQTNTVAPDSFAYYAVTVPTNADIATNILLSTTGGPVNLLFNQTTLPTGLGAGDFTLLPASTGGSTNLTLAGSPPLIPGQTYYLGVQNTNSTAVAFGVEVDFDLVFTSPITNYPISGIIFTNIGGTNGILLTWYAPTNYQFQIQWTTSLSPAPISWTTVPGVTPTLVNVTGTTGTYQWFDNFSLTGGFGLQKFYRLIAYPPGVAIPPSLVISGIEALPGGGFQIQWTGSTNYNYEILWTTNLALPAANWTVLTNLNNPPLTLTYAGGVFTLDTGTLTTGAASAFFQVVELP